jgi:hypothetical protein
VLAFHVASPDAERNRRYVDAGLILFSSP